MKAKLLNILLLLCLRFYSQEIPTLKEQGMKYLISADFEKAIEIYSQAIKKDSLAYENYYFRAIALTYTLKDT